MIYPALTYLEEIGYATVEEDRNRKLFSITESGRRHLEENRTIVDSMLNELGRIGAKMEHVRRAFTGEDAEDESDGFSPRGSREVNAARRAVKEALHQKRNCSPEESKRIAEILRRAAAEILSKP
jgi:DNA-binding PadR family transcriptional regulator